MTSSQKIVLITGGNQGVGFETAKNLLSSSAKYHVLLGSRDFNKGKEAAAGLESTSILGSVSVIKIDVSTIRVFSVNPVKRDAFREVLAINCVGVVSVTEAFLSLLKKSSPPRLIFVGTSAGSLTHAADPSSRFFNPIGAVAYRTSKAALSMILMHYHGLLSPDGFKVFGADPGLIATNLTGDKESLIKRGAAEGHVGGERVACVVRGDRDSDVGRVCGVYGVMSW